MKKVLSVILCLAMVMALFSGCGKKEASNTADATPTQESTPTPTVADDPASLKGEFTWWTYFDQAPYLKAEFEKKYPNVKIDLQTFGGDQYETKLMTTIQSGQGIPDLMDLEEGYVYKFLDSPVFADLGALGGNDLVKDYYPWAVGLGKDSKGTLKGISDNISPVAFWYTRSAMKQWLGTDDADQIAEKLSDWDKIIAVAKDVKEKSGGKVYLWPNLNEIVKVEGYSITPFVRDGKFAMDPKWNDVLKLMRTIHDEKLSADLGSWGQEWATAWNNGTLLIRVMPSWDFFTDWKKNTGNVGVAKPPKNSYEGATIRAIYDKSEKKDLVMAFLKFLTTPEYQIGNLNTNNQMPINKTVIDQIGTDYKAEKFGNQNILKTYNEIASNIPDIIPDKYTRDVQNMFAKHAEEGIKKGLSDQQIIDNFKKEVKDKYPEIQGL
jgi:multiple sugar transport system substrate-binding protein